MLALLHVIQLIHVYNSVCTQTNDRHDYMKIPWEHSHVLKRIIQQLTSWILVGC